MAPPQLTLSFHGGAGTVTGSRHLLDLPGARILVDAGLFQGLKELRELNWKTPAFDPASVGQLLLTHTHIDHAGYLPKLVREGYRGPIHCTPATAELAGLLLMDSAKLQEEDAEFANRKGFTRHRPALPLYTAADAEAALRRLRTIDYGEWLPLPPQARARYLNAGHILGSAHIEVRVEADGTAMTLLFSGDVGRYDMPLHVDPTAPPACDVLIVESTYGDRKHPSEPFAAQIRGPMLDTFQQGGVVLIPAYAVGRAQQVTLILRDMMRAGQLPEVPIHIDSPMAVDATEIYSRHLRDHNLDEGLGEERREEDREGRRERRGEERREGHGEAGGRQGAEPGAGPSDGTGDRSASRKGDQPPNGSAGQPGDDPRGARGSGSRLFPRSVFFHRTVEQSKALNALRGPRVIISSSGMLTGGRVLHHLAQRMPDPKNLIVLVGFQAEGTRGRALEHGAKTVRLHGMEVPVRARVLMVHGLSGHADQDELLRWIRSSAGLPKRVFITHGEPPAAAALAQRIQHELGVKADVPQLGQSFALA